MDTFLSLHQDSVFGTLTTFDRMIFKGHLSLWYQKGAFARWLNRQGVLLKDFKLYVEAVSQRIKRHAEQLGIQSGWPFRYLEGFMTAKNGQSKEALVQQIAAESHLQEGLICVFSTLESCSTFTVRGNHQTHKLEVIRRRSKCLHFSFYYLDAELGFIHCAGYIAYPSDLELISGCNRRLASEFPSRKPAGDRIQNKQRTEDHPKVRYFEPSANH